MKKILKTILSIIIILIGFLIFLQASDMNPLLLNEDYSKWINTRYYSIEYPTRNNFMILFTMVLGALIMAIGMSIMPLRKKKIKNNLASITLPDTAVFKEPDNTIIKDIHLDKAAGEITMKLDFGPDKQD